MRAYFVRFILTGDRYTSFTFVAKDDQHALELITSFVSALCDDKPNYELADVSVTTKPRKIVEF
jgi:hypothetical protein